MKKQNGSSPWLAIPYGIFAIALGVSSYVNYHISSNWLSILVPLMLIITGIIAIGKRINLILRKPRLQILSIGLTIVAVILILFSMHI